MVGSLGRVLLQWAQAVASIKQLHKNATKCKALLKKLLNHVVWQSMNAWSSFVSGEKRKKEVIKRLKVKVGGHSISMCFTEWVIYIKDAVAFKHQVVRASKSALKVLRSTTAVAFDDWVHNLKLGKRLRVICQKLFKRSMAASFVKWQFTVHAVRRKTIAMQRAASVLSRRSLLSSFVEWCQYLHQNRRLSRTSKRSDVLSEVTFGCCCLFQRR